MTDEEQKAEKYVRETYCKDCDGKKHCLASKCFNIHKKDYLEGRTEGHKEVDLELIHIINDIIKYHDDEETRKDEYETSVFKLAKYWEKLGKIELAEWTVAQIGVNAWTIQ